MTIPMAILLGLVQGLTEFLPVSSSGHLNLFQALFGVQLDHQLLFNIVLHVGTLAAVAVVFWKDWLDMIRHPIKNRTLGLLFLASLPALAAKLLFDEQLDLMEGSVRYLGIFFMITGIFLMITQMLSQYREKHHILQKEQVGVVSALVMGCLQAVGMLPGISRSGSTIFGGTLARLDRKAAAKFSFMMSAPAIVGSLLSEGKEALKSGFSFGNDWAAVLIGMVVAGISGYLAIRFFMRLISKHSLYGFALYMILLGIAVILLQTTGVLQQTPQVAAGVEAAVVGVVGRG